MKLLNILCYRPHTWTRIHGLVYSNTGNRLKHSHTHLNGKQVLISTPIFYVNSDPHIGHLYTTILADTLANWHRLQERDVLFATGTDEHGLKIQQAAEKQGTELLTFCDQISAKFKNLCHVADIGYSDFIRTTENRHKATVIHLWNTLQEKGYIYKGSYEGWYCTSDEAFLTQLDITEVQNKDGVTVKVSKESGHPVEWVQEENYMFRLSEFQTKLLEWLDKKVIFPAHPYEAQVRDSISSGLQDLSVSRQRERLLWGIPVPGDDTQTIYVWLDALTNYLTVCGYPGHSHSWDTAYHLVGKDIIKFHAVYWPAFLMAAGLNPPKAIYCHAHWLRDHKKMSKSIGNVVDPFTCIEKYGSDGLRYFLLSEGRPQSDGHFSEKSILNHVNSELVNTLGNLLSRCTGSKLNPDQVVPQFHVSEWELMSDDEDRAMWDRLDYIAEKVSHHFENFEMHMAINLIMSQLRDTNTFIQKHKPWELVNDTGNHSRDRLDTVLHVSLHTLRICGILLQPVIPKLSDKLLTRLNVDKSDRKWDNAVRGGDSNIKSLARGNSILMKRIK